MSNYVTITDGSMYSNTGGIRVNAKDIVGKPIVIELCEYEFNKFTVSDNYFFLKDISDEGWRIVHIKELDEGNVEVWAQRPKIKVSDFV